MNKFIILLAALTLLGGCFGRNVRPGGDTATNAAGVATTTTVAVTTATTVAPLIDMSMAEQAYSDAINLIYDGYYDQALTKLKYLVDKQVFDRYVFETLLQLYINKAEQYSLQGNNARMAATVKEARGVAELALKCYPTDIRLLQVYTDIVRTAGDTEAFLAGLDKILKLYPGDIFGNYYTGAYYYFSNKTEKATFYFENVIVNPMPGTEFELTAIYYSFYYLGLIALHNGNYEDSIVYLERAKIYVGFDLEIAKTLGLLYSQLLYFEDAERSYSEIPGSMLTKDIVDPYIGVMLVNGSEKLDEIASDFYYNSTFAKAVKNYLRGNYTNALRELDRIPADSSVLYYSHYLKYLIYSQDVTNADNALKEAFVLGKLAKDIGNYPVAIEYFKKVEGYRDAVPDIYWLIGSLYDDSGDATNAIAYYERYINYGTTLEYATSARIRLAFMYYTIGRMQDSLAQVEIAKRTARTSDERYTVYFYSGLMNFELAKYDAAIADFMNALTNQPDYYALYYYIASTYAQQEKYDKAIEYLQIARTKTPNVPEVNNLLAYIYALKQEELDEALKLINLALLKEPDNIAYLDTLGWVYFQRSEYDKAFEVYMSLERTVAGRTNILGLDEIYYHIGMIYEKKGDREEATKYYKLGLNFNPQNGYIRARLDALGAR